MCIWEKCVDIVAATEGIFEIIMRMQLIECDELTGLDYEGHMVDS